VYVCGGGACNGELLRRLQAALSGHGINAGVFSTAALGIAPNHVEALAFAWLAQRFDASRTGNLPAVTGANGPRILGALYPA
jgi:anhydro-N-acetylmuramic acid kinase